MKKKSKIFVWAMIILMFSVLIATLFINDNSLANRVVTIITVVTAVIGALALFFQFKRDKDVNQANFIIEYSKFFNSLKDVPETMIKLDRYRKGDKKALDESAYDGIVNYLQWCESLSVLVQKGVVTLELIDNLYSYNFFLIANNDFVQQRELIPEAEYYKGVYLLHKMWTDYKKRTRQPILQEETSLDKVPNYEAYVQKGNLFDKKHY